MDVHPEALRGWVKRAEADEGIAPRITSGDAARIVELKWWSTGRTVRLDSRAVRARACFSTPRTTC
ncbi:hypothetical protein A6P39_029065 [Streptomyces sp. FXJ1.172]|uniref:hypothetical protein n=1 Tax=Streptomyces sp. FXJ1.172 TaxID=710705 RepID=UPI0023DD65C4|nr:hypothetical protein [Streptomyces sp. FXJ1.172]WEO97740.1 hypothetical protein A6P39_029065 [Streptomyces sp. FXJ1.172]